MNAFRTNSIQNKIEINQLVTEYVTVKPVKFRRKIGHKSNGLAHLKLGLHVTPDTDPCWQYGLIDSGCTDSLISLQALKALPDFADISIIPTQHSTIRTANNDQSQTIHGKINLNVSLMTDKNVRICFLIPFYVVSGLVYQIFIGQNFLTSPYKPFETTSHLFFKADPDSDNSADLLHLVAKTYLVKKTAHSVKRQLIPANSAIRIKTDTINIPNLTRELFCYFKPSLKFKQQNPALHIAHQTSQKHANGYDVMVFNTSSQPLSLRARSHLGSFNTEFKNNAIIEPLRDFLGDTTPSPSPLTTNHQEQYYCPPVCVVAHQLSPYLQQLFSHNFAPLFFRNTTFLISRLHMVALILLLCHHVYFIAILTSLYNSLATLFWVLP
jgi:hypothetical protein